MSRRGPRAGLANRLMIGQVLVILSGAAALAGVATAIAPAVFRSHLGPAAGTPAEVRQHAEAAFASALGLSVAAATLVALVAAGLVSWFVVRRVSGAVEELAGAADAVSQGNYRVVLPAATFSTELQRLAGAFAAMANQLADTEAARSRLLADVAHEVRTPLATLQAYIDGLEDGVVAAEPQAWETMRSQVRRLHRLAADLREAAAAEEHALDLVPTPLDAAAVATAAAAAARPRYQAKGVALDLAVELAGATAVVRADEERLHQVLANLLDNALRHTPAGGHVGLCVGAGAGSVRIAVRDDGEGLPSDQLEAVFERFHRADPARSASGGGSGLGLTIARAIVREHGGTLAAASAGPGRGATFTVQLPAAAEAGSI